MGDIMQNPVFERICQDIAAHEIVVYMKGSAVFPQCRESAAIVCALEDMGARYVDIDVLLDPGLHQGIQDFTRTNHVPQLYVRGEYVYGGAGWGDGQAVSAIQALLRERGLIQQ